MNKTVNTNFLKNRFKLFWWIFANVIYKDPNTDFISLKMTVRKLIVKTNIIIYSEFIPNLFNFLCRWNIFAPDQCNKPQ